jgi:hypothetical protein
MKSAYNYKKPTFIKKEPLMAQFEYKVVKCRVVDQEYFTSWLSAYGWQVQNIQEVVDQVVNQSMGFSTNTGNSNMYGRVYFPHKSDHAHYSGNQYSYGWGSQMNTSVTNVKTKLTITFFRDTALPNRPELNAIEARWWKTSERYLNRVIKQGNANGGKNWPEFIELQSINKEAWAVRNRKQPAQTPPPVKDRPVETKPKQIENKPVQVPNLPAAAMIKSMAVTHNAIQSGQPGIQISLIFTLKNRKGFSCGILAYFYDENHNALTDLNNKFKTVTGKVCVGTSFKPDFDDALFNDYILFMPYAELDQPDGSRKLYFEVKIFDDIGKVFIANTDQVYFNFIKNGSDMRAETTSAPARSQSTPARQPAARKPAAPARPGVPPAIPAAPKTPAQRKAAFREQTKWTEQSENRKMFLDGLFLDIEGKHNEALKIYQKVLELEPANEEFIIQVSNALFASGKKEESLNVLQAGLDKLPSNPKLQHWQAMTYIRNQDFANAEKIIAALTACKEKGAGFYAAYSQAYLAETRREYKSAIRFYDQADKLAEDPENNPLKGLGQKRCRDQQE